VEAAAGLSPPDRHMTTLPAYEAGEEKKRDPDGYKPPGIAFSI
jgi:hypothetical protein